jgi:general secretion pathway protein D
MNVEQEVSSISNSVSVKTSDIVTDKRAIRTSVLVDNGQVIVLGGLIDDQIQDQQQRVPLLASIPIFGHLFRYDNRTTTKRNLMVFLRPSIMRVAGDASDLTLSKYRYIRDQQLKARGLNAGELNGRDALLPPYEDANKGVVHPESSNDGGSTR